MSNPNDMNKDKQIIFWLYTCCFMVFAMAVIGAVTRLTESGLSMVEWRPLIGAIPPLSETEWQRVYEAYKQSPEFEHKHNWMALEDFRKIFFWEWLHRFWGRLIGLVYALPLLWFWLRGQIPAGYKPKFLGALALGALQGLIGWWMVKSGLVDNPEVSHYRLAIHLAIAFVIFGWLWWLALSLRSPQNTGQQASAALQRLGWLSLALLFITIIWGAFTAGLDAGKIYNSFPFMNGTLTPPEQFNISSIFEEHGWVQFTHRWLAITTGIVILVYAMRLKDFFLAGMVFIQVGLGISTLLTQVAIPLAAAHQAGALILLALLLKRIVLAK